MTAPVVVGVDGSPPSLDAVRWAATEARRLGRDLLLLHAELPMPGNVDDSDGRLRAALHARSCQWLQEARLVAPGVPTRFAVHVGEPAEVLLTASGESSLLVLGSRGAGGFDALLAGSTVLSVAGHARCPVVVVRGEDRPGPVVCGVVDSPAASDVLGRAFEHAAARGAGVVAVNAWHVPPGVAVLADAADVDLSRHDEARGTLLAHLVAPLRHRYPLVPVDLAVERGRRTASCWNGPRERPSWSWGAGDRARCPDSSSGRPATPCCTTPRAPCWW